MIGNQGRRIHANRAFPGRRRGAPEGALVLFNCGLVFSSICCDSANVRGKADHAKVADTWDAHLPETRLTNVHIRAERLQDAWKDIATHFLLRSILYVRDDTEFERAFEFQAHDCTAKDIFDYFKNNYTDFTSSQDTRTGVIWFHPADLSYHDILNQKIHVGFSQRGLRMQEDVLESLESDELLNVRAKRWGTSFKNMFNYPVDIPSGEYTIRDLLNQCCLSQPGTTFYATRYARGFDVVSAVSLVPARRPSTMRPGEVAWWRHTFGSDSASGPTSSDVLAKLTDQDEHVRRTARSFIPVTTALLPIEQWPDQITNPEKALWACLGLTSVFVRTADVTFAAGLKRMKKEADKGVLKACPRDLAVLVALDLTRLTNDVTYIEKVSKRRFEKGDLSDCVAEMCCMARHSATIREYLSSGGCGWLSLSGEDQEALERILTSTKLEFTTQSK